MLRRIAPGASARTAAANKAKSFHQHSERSSVSGRGGQVLEIGPIDGPGMEKMVNGLYEIEAVILSRVKQILESK